MRPDLSFEKRQWRPESALAKASTRQPHPLRHTGFENALAYDRFGAARACCPSIVASWALPVRVHSAIVGLTLAQQLPGGLPRSHRRRCCEEPAAARRRGLATVLGCSRLSRSTTCSTIININFAPACIRIQGQISVDRRMADRFGVDRPRPLSVRRTGAHPTSAASTHFRAQSASVTVRSSGICRQHMCQVSVRNFDALPVRGRL
jgi:hypothetical protein